MVKNKLSASAMIFSGLLLSFNAFAAVVVDHNLSLDVGTDYHSNIQLLDDSIKESAYIYRAVPEYRMSALDASNEWYGVLGIVLQRSSNSALVRDRENPYARLGWKRQLENGLFSIEGQYIEESTRLSQFGTTNAVTQDSDSKAKILDALWEHRLSEKLGLELGANYQRYDFSGEAGFVDYNVYSLSSKLAYARSEFFTPYTIVRVNRFMTDGGGLQRLPAADFKYQDVLVGAEVQWSPKLSFDAQTGITRISSLDQDEWVGLIEGEYLGPRYTVSGNIRHDIAPTSQGIIVKRDQLGLGYLYNLTERSNWSVQLTLARTSQNIDAQSILGVYQRELTAYWTVRGQAGYRNIKSSGTPSRDDKTVGIYFVYQTQNLTNE